MRKWSDVLPHTLAQRQVYWERRRRIWRAWAAGASYAEIGRKLGITKGRVQYICERVEREIKRKMKSPVEGFLAGTVWFDLRVEIEAKRKRARVVREQREQAERWAEHARWRKEYAKDIDASIRRISEAIEVREALRERIPHWGYREDKTLPQEQAELIVNLAKVRENLDLLGEMGFSPGDAWTHLMRPY
jgi:hypothetical protein